MVGVGGRSVAITRVTVQPHHSVNGCGQAGTRGWTVVALGNSTSAMPGHARHLPGCAAQARPYRGGLSHGEQRGQGGEVVDQVGEDAGGLLAVEPYL